MKREKMFTIVDVHLMRLNFEYHQEELLCQANCERLVRQAGHPDFIPQSRPRLPINFKGYGKRLFRPFSQFTKHSS